MSGEGPHFHYICLVYFFNPEHDLCLANGNANYVPPDSARRFGLDCRDIMNLPGLDDGRKIKAWGWDFSLKRRLIRQGVPEEDLPSDHEIAAIRDLSHRRRALQAAAFIRNHISSTVCLLPEDPVEITGLDALSSYIESHHEAVAKAPWSGSGKGLRWLRYGELHESDTGWCARTISGQGSLIVCGREKILAEFAMIFRLSAESAEFEGFSYFRTNNGIYSGNLLASDDKILRLLSAYVPIPSILEIRDALTMFLNMNFTGKYRGYLGADMFVCEHGGRKLLMACSEINVRMTMGLIARKFHGGCFTKEHPEEDGTCWMKVVHAPNFLQLSEILTGAEQILTEPSGESRYAIAVFRE